MVYVMSDIHGEYEAYLSLLDKISFSDSDELYIIGDVIDRGDEPIKLLQDMMARPNVFPIIGNHEYMALKVLRGLMNEITEESCERVLTKNFMTELLMWQENGGNVTIEKFGKLNFDEKNDIIEYLEEFSLYENIEVNGREFVLVHAGLDNFSPLRDLEDYHLHEMIFNIVSYDRVYYNDKLLVTGHKPTLSEEGNDGEVIMKNNHIAIDCGKVFGGKLAAVCLDTLEAFYV